ncbi:patatin-like phospholipase family protein [Maribacter sp. ACAM166]|uniref:patatin-like phospholipase family protein n=1 Tax=Maribacter sp. ACAM166 TaxID=2508996 RepID=UPI0010FDA615|nr:patatin-like phospholipase family protein [Maribacter sp. ACAM166]TLP77280.1 patatin-like phospholipase family protein [Maribacter sp. ACAM166]
MKTGLVLSGGGVRGVAHIGAIKALEEHDIYPSHIAGTSAGAIVGALYAGGCRWEEMLDFFKTVELFSINKYAINKPGLIDTSRFYDVLLSYLPKDNFNALKIPLYITATNLLDGTLKVFHKGPLIKPILASAAVPGFFAPVQIKDGYYVDGGTLNIFPVDLIKTYCDLIVGVYVNPFEKVRIEDLKHAHNVLERAYHIKVANESISKFDDCNLLIRPKDMGNFGMFSMKNIDTIFQLGYESAIDALNNIYTLEKSILTAEFEAMNGFSADTI